MRREDLYTTKTMIPSIFHLFYRDIGAFPIVDATYANELARMLVNELLLDVVVRNMPSPV